LEDVPCDQLPQILKGLVRYVARDKAVEVRKGELVSLTAFANLKATEPVTETLSKETAP